jgi:3' terminal RNA ribose 2'-O-methyltransferase Hen1
MDVGIDGGPGTAWVPAARSSALCCRQAAGARLLVAPIFAGFKQPMYLSISTTHRPATDLGYLLHKNPANVHVVDLPFGQAVGFYPEADEDRCTFALVLDVDPVGLVRGFGGGDGLLAQYVNDRSYAASSFLSVALGQSLRSAMGGRSKERPELVDQPLPLTATIAPVAAGGDPDLPGRLFRPLGYVVEFDTAPLAGLPAHGSRYGIVRVAGQSRLRDLLTHLYVLVPVLDGNKHYFVGQDELEKLLQKGEGWLREHPERELIATRYLKRRRSLIREAMARLMEAEDASEEQLDVPKSETEETLEAPVRLNDTRLAAVVRALQDADVARVVDLGCGEGKLLSRLLADRRFQEIVGVDISARTLEIAGERLKLDRMPERQRARIKLLQGALTYRDRRIEGFDAATLVEVIEHVEEDRLPGLARVVFDCAKPRLVVVTTPNREYNRRFASLPAGKFRHADHRFEWTRAQFEAWGSHVATAYAYQVRFEPIGEVDPEVGAPTQMAVFAR